MDVRWAAAILLGTIAAGRMDAAEKIQVDVYLQQNNWPQPLTSATGLASEIFAKSGVHVTWHAGELPAVPKAGRPSIGIRMVTQAPDTLAPGALASARPFGSSGSLISIYQDRVQRQIAGLPSLSNILLGYIFAHELAHVMLGNDYHSPSGILRAHWLYPDYEDMRTRRLAFTDDDSERIRSGLAVTLAAR